MKRNILQMHQIHVLVNKLKRKRRNAKRKALNKHIVAVVKTMLMYETNYAIQKLYRFRVNIFYFIYQMDEISRSVREVNKLLNTTNVLPSNSIVSNTVINRSLLQIQHKNLNPSYEMKRMFGSKVVQSEQQ